MTIMRNFVLALLLLASVLGGIGQAQDAQIETITLALQAGEFSRAIELCRVALKGYPGNTQLWAMQGVAYAGLGQNKLALESFHAALKISPNYIPALQGAIQIEFSDGSAAAIPHLKRLLILRPADQTSHGMLAVLEYQQGNCADAVVHFEKAGTLFDSKPDGLHAYATCLVKLKQF